MVTFNLRVGLRVCKNIPLETQKRRLFPLQLVVSETGEMLQNAQQCAVFVRLSQL
jgi:hypothetical protein